MFRIARVRIRWTSTNQHSANAVLPTQPARAPDSTLRRRPWMFDPQHIHVRVSWVGLGSRSGAIVPATKPATGHPGENTTPSSGRVLGGFDMPKARVRVIWLGLGSVSRRTVWTLGLLAALLLGLFAFTRLAYRSDTNSSSNAAQAVPVGLVADDIPLGNETIRMIHSPLDIGEAKDVFDNNIDTLMRGRDANPFIIDLQFSRPQAIKGLEMYFGRMDFVMRVQVYGIGDPKPISYQGEYRQQPDIPHIAMDFTNGPDQVTRLHIEIEQLNAPDEVHIHVREIIFKR